MSRKGRLVYQAGPGGARSERHPTCSRCGRAPCACEPRESLAPERQSPRARRERKGRRGKTVTVVSPFLLTREDALELLAHLKRGCGGGGALKPGTTPKGEPCFVLEVQGEHEDRVVELLRERGYRA